MIRSTLQQRLVVGASLIVLLANALNAQQHAVMLQEDAGTLRQEAPSRDAAEAPTTRPSDATAARAVLDATVAKYRSLKSYRDKFHYEARLATKGGDEPQLGYLEGTLVFAAPDRLASKSEAVHVYYDGERLTQFMPQMRQYTVSDGPAALRSLVPGEAVAFNAGGLGVHPLAILLANRDLCADEALAIAEVTDVQPEIRDGRAGQRLSGQLRLPMIPGGGLIPFTAFINDQTQLFEEVRVDVTAAVRADAEEAEVPDVDRAEIVLTFTDVEVDGDVPDEAFTFDSAGASKVDMFGFVPERVTSPLELLGQFAPALAGPTLDGAAFDLATQRGRVAVVVFWGSWTPKAQGVLTDLQQLAAAHVEHPLVVIGVNRNAAAGEAAVRRLLERSGASFQQVLDRVGDLAERWHVAALPAVFLIDPQGVVADVYPSWSGAVCETVGRQITKLLRSEPLYTADELAARRAESDDAGQSDGMTLRLPADALDTERLEIADTQTVRGSRWNMTEQDVDGDGEPELILPNWQGGLSVVDPTSGEVKTVRLRNLQQVSLQTVRGVAIDGEICWLCAGSKHATMPGAAAQQQAVVRLHAPDGEVLWTFRPDVPEGTTSQACAAAGDLDGDGVVEYAIGLATYVQVPMGENSYSLQDMTGKLIILDHQGELIAQREMPQQIQLLYIPVAPSGKPAPLLCISGGQLERYTLKPRAARDPRASGSPR